MDYDFRNKGPPYDTHIPMYRPTAMNTSSSSAAAAAAPPHISNLYPKIGQPGHPVGPPPSRNPPNHPNAPPSSSGLGIRVSIKPEYQITPQPQLLPLMGEIPRSSFQFDFDFERRILAEAEKENQNWGLFGLESLPLRTAESASSLGSVTDPVVSKYIASGLSREAVPLAVANHGDNPVKVREFVNGYTLLREMGFKSSSIAQALAMYDNDTDKALAYFLNSNS